MKTGHKYKTRLFKGAFGSTSLARPCPAEEREEWVKSSWVVAFSLREQRKFHFLAEMARDWPELESGPACSERWWAVSQKDWILILVPPTWSHVSMPLKVSSELTQWEPRSLHRFDAIFRAPCTMPST